MCNNTVSTYSCTLANFYFFQQYNGRYEIKSDVPFGKAIIICNHEFDDTSHNRTPGSEEDVKLLRTLARRMSFTNREFLNLGKQVK